MAREKVVLLLCYAIASVHCQGNVSNSETEIDYVTHNEQEILLSDATFTNKWQTESIDRDPYNIRENITSDIIDSDDSRSNLNEVLQESGLNNNSQQFNLTKMWHNHAGISLNIGGTEQNSATTPQNHTEKSLNTINKSDLIFTLTNDMNSTASNVQLETFSSDDVEYLEPHLSDEHNIRHCPRGSPKPCVVKCCPLGKSIGPNKKCETSDLKFEVQFFGEHDAPNYTASEDMFDMIYGDPCPYGKYRLEPMMDSNDEFHILKNGSIRAPYLFPYPLNPDEYCLEVFADSGYEEEDIMPLICFKDPPPKSTTTIQYILYPIGLLISVPFLIVTMLVYCLIPELRDLHGKCLVCHVFCLAVAYIFLATVQLIGQTLNEDMCTGVAFVIQFSFVACFFWLNILCLDTWWNVIANVRIRWGSRPENNNYMCYSLLDGEVFMKKKTERKIFIFYSLYAWCFPILIVIISMIVDLMPTIPSSYLKPNFGLNKCWFNTEEAELHYFYAPVGFLIGINVLFFILAAWKVYAHKWQHGEAKRTPRQMFRMCLTLFGVMGINWVMEVISWAAGGPDYIWYFTDVLNTLQGVIIFCIFVLEPRVRDLVRLQLWPKISEKICKQQKTSPHKTVLYNSPGKAVNNV